MNWSTIQTDSTRLCGLFFKNCDYLRKERGLSIQDMVRAMRAHGIIVSRHSIRLWQSGRYGGTARLNYLHAWATFFGRSVSEMLAVDYEAEASLK